MANGFPSLKPGTLQLAGAAAGSEELPPIVNSRRCRITRPLLEPATITRQWGRGWRVDLDAARRKRLLQQTPMHRVLPDATVAHWVVEAPWSSEVIHSYSLILVHLRFDLIHAPVMRYLEGATHELALFAINPEADRGLMLRAPTDGRSWLQPAVFAAQVVEPSDEAVAARVARTVELICDGRLSPHPAHMRSWVELFGDNMMRQAQPACVSTEEGTT